MNEPTQNPAAIRSTNKLLSRTHVKKFALSMAENRAHVFTRVGAEFFDKVEANTKNFIRDYVSRLPSRGKTIL